MKDQEYNKRLEIKRSLRDKTCSRCFHYIPKFKMCGSVRTDFGGIKSPKKFSCGAWDLYDGLSRES